MKARIKPQAKKTSTKTSKLGPTQKACLTYVIAEHEIDAEIDATLASKRTIAATHALEHARDTLLDILLGTTEAIEQYTAEGSKNDPILKAHAAMARKARIALKAFGAPTTLLCQPLAPSRGLLRRSANDIVFSADLA